MKSIIGRHRIRANFYHFVSLLYVLTMAFWSIGLLSDMASTWIGFILFTVDYLAQMYDPHPDNPGPWFKRHFHRFLEDEEEAPEVNISITTIKIMLVFALVAFVLALFYIKIATITALAG